MNDLSLQPATPPIPMTEEEAIAESLAMHAVATHHQNQLNQYAASHSWASAGYVRSQGDCGFDSLVVLQTLDGYCLKRSCAPCPSTFDKLWPTSWQPITIPRSLGPLTHSSLTRERPASHTRTSFFACEGQASAMSWSCLSSLRSQRGTISQCLLSCLRCVNRQYRLRFSHWRTTTTTIHFFWHYVPPRLGRTGCLSCVLPPGLWRIAS